MRPVRAILAVIAGLMVAASACRSPFGPLYEYEEQIYLRVDGAATVVVDSSIAALVALRGVALDPAAPASTDRANLRSMFEAAGCHVDNVGQPWRRKGRRFVQVRISTPDVRTLSKCGLLSWSSYALGPHGEGLRFHQVVGAPAVRDPGQVNWDGTELVAVKLHAPSRVRDHNVRLLEADEPGAPERGNILTWEQRLTDRRSGKPVEMLVSMDGTSILYTTLWLFAGAATAAVGALALIVWLTVRRGRRQVAARQS